MSETTPSKSQEKYLRNRDKIRSRQAAYEATHKAERSVRNAEYYQAHKEERQAYSREYIKKNKEHVAELKRAYNIAHAEEVKAYREAYRTVHTANERLRRAIKSGRPAEVIEKLKEEQAIARAEFERTKGGQVGTANP